jgi:UDP-N-acetylmuramoyl-tripeptide--D-alanyl-D-alanine ligase
MTMTMVQIRAILHAPGPANERVVSGYSIDSRTMQAGDLFFAIQGERFDGHEFVVEALSQGAVAAVISKPQRERFSQCDSAKLIEVGKTLDALQQLARAVRDRWNGTVVAVTGSVGKTTTKEMIAKVLSAKYSVLKSHGNLNNHYGLPMQLLKVDTHHQFAVLEMGMSAAGEIAALARIAGPKYGVVTTVAPVHTEFFSDGIEGVARAKRELIEALPPNGVAFLNADDARVAAMRDHSLARVITFGRSEADVRATNIQDRGIAGTAFTVQARGERAECSLRLIGAHNVTNALAAIAVGLEAGMALGECAAALEEMSAPDGRGQTLALDGASVINDCYNSNPLALDSMVTALAGVKAERRIVVAGEMMELGADAESLHAACGRHMATAGIHIVVGVRGNARTIVEGAVKAGVQALFLETPEAAGDWLAENLRSGDAVLLKASRGVKLERALQRLLDLRKDKAK